MTPSKTLALTEKLISLSSVTPDDKGCQQHLIDLLTPLGFVCETIESNGVTNLWARRGTTSPVMVFAGHTDVVPTGPVEMALAALHPDPPRRQAVWPWRSRHEDLDRRLRGGLRRVHRQHADHKGSIAFLITSDEEGPATDGTVIVCNI
jgi:succinyl-diaminopimelate desuccinylase